MTLAPVTLRSVLRLGVVRAVRARYFLRSARDSRAANDDSPFVSRRVVSARAPKHTREVACAPQAFAALLLFSQPLLAATLPLQQRIDAAAPHSTIRIEAGVHNGALVINKPLTLAGDAGAEIRGDHTGKVVTIAANDVTLRDLRITGSGLKLLEDDAAVFVTGNRVTIEHCVIANSLHGVYLKKVSGARVLENRIQGKTTIPVSGEPVEKGVGQSTENCDTALLNNWRGNGVHQWNCDGNLIRGNDISDTRDGIYFSFTNNSRAENNYVHQTRYGLHYMYSDTNAVVNNTFSDNAAGGAIMFSKEALVRGNRFLSNRGQRAYGLIVQSSDRCRFEDNVVEKDAVGLSFNQCNGNEIARNRVCDNYIGLKFAANQDSNQFTENVFAGNLHTVETGGSDIEQNAWAVNGVGNLWDNGAEIDLNHDGIGDLPHREVDLFGLLRRNFPPIAFLSGSPAVKLLQFANQRAQIPGVSSIEDPAPLTREFWKIRARRASTAAGAR